MKVTCDARRIDPRARYARRIGAARQNCGPLKAWLFSQGRQTQRLSMILLAHCQSCGLVFEGLRFPGGVGPGSIIAGNVALCPRCGSRAPIDEVIGGVVRSAIAFAHMPGVTREVLVSARQLARELSEGRKSLEQVRQEASRIHPHLAPSMTDWLSAGSNVLMMIIAALMLYLTAQKDQNEHKKDQRDEQRIERMTAALERVSRQNQSANDQTPDKAQQKNRKTRRPEAAQNRKKKRS